jgi:hypothetical protein
MNKGKFTDAVNLLQERQFVVELHTRGDRFALWWIHPDEEWVTHTSIPAPQGLNILAVAAINWLNERVKQDGHPEQWAKELQR